MYCIINIIKAFYTKRNNFISDVVLLGVKWNRKRGSRNLFTSLFSYSHNITETLSSELPPKYSVLCVKTVPVSGVQRGDPSWEQPKCLYSWRPWGLQSVNMSRATKRKHVTREVEQDLTLPQQGQTIVKVRILTLPSCRISCVHFYHVSNIISVVDNNRSV